MPDSAQHSSSPSFVFFKHSLLASRAYTSPPQRASLTELPASFSVKQHRDAGVKGGNARVRGVVQDKGLRTQALKASEEPGSVVNGQSPEAAHTNNHRSQSRAPAPVKLVHSTFWIDPRVRAEMVRQADEMGISFSEVGARACAAWVRYTIQQQQDDLFEPRLRHMMREEIQAIGERLVFFEMRNAFASEQTRIITIDLYKRQLQKEGVSREKFYELLDKSDAMARKNITQKSPKFKGMLADWEADNIEIRRKDVFN
jgi:hypothetical protein